MDKQKQIEEMAKVIEEAMAKARRTLGGHNNIAKFYATMLVNVGYRKIPANAVVLTRDEYNLLNIAKKTWASDGEEVQASTLIDTLKRVRKAERKETAEKFAERVKMAFYYHFDELIPSIMADKIDEICKEITEGK